MQSYISFSEWAKNISLSWIALIVCVGSDPTTAKADEIVAGTTTFQAMAIQDVMISSTASINPTGQDLFFDDLFGFSSATIIREQQAGDVIAISGLEGWSFEGSNVLGDFRFGIVGPFTGDDYFGTISNVQQDMNDPGFATGDPSSFVSGDYFITGTGFGVEFTSGPLMGTILRTDPNQVFEFESVFDGLPPSPGTLISTTPGSDQVLDIYLTNLNGDLIELVGTSSDRRILVVPEPGSTGAIALSVLICIVHRRRNSH